MAFPPGVELQLTAEDVENGGMQEPPKEDSQHSIEAVQSCFKMGFMYVGQFIGSVKDVWQCGHIPEGVRDKLAVLIRDTWPVIQATTTMMNELDYVLEPLITSKHQIAQIFEKSDELTLELAIHAARDADKEVDLKAIRAQMWKLAELIQKWSDVQISLRTIASDIKADLPHMEEAAQKFETCHKSAGLLIIAGTLTVAGIVMWSGLLGELPQSVVSTIASYPGASALALLTLGRGSYAVTQEASRHTVNFIADLINLEKNADLAHQEVSARVADLERLYKAVDDMVEKTKEVDTVVSESHRKERRLAGPRGDFMTALRKGDDEAAVAKVLALMKKPEVREALAKVATDDKDKCEELEVMIAQWKEHAEKVRAEFVSLKTKVECDMGSDKLAKMTIRKDD